MRCGSSGTCVFGSFARQFRHRRGVKTHGRVESCFEFLFQVRIRVVLFRHIFLVLEDLLFAVCVRLSRYIFFKFCILGNISHF
jgi:hypothetical protein